ncbi:unnamed protein product [Adineta steineri]|uniref:Uncharacterized protein n=1 Tax=Adineta steineri TaxID=433720 RepID=A0A816DVA7_9BILA|nr:unnamed protein product [Adineta steineri]CAF1642353.1 unnamed protein product [Adineta steineri]
MFFNEFCNDFPHQKYPLLIGIMRLFERDNTNEIIRFDYQFQTLIIHDKLMHIQIFAEKTRLSWEVVDEIADYLSLNDAINAFSNDILPLLDHSQAKFHLFHHSARFIKKILPKIKYGKTVSLELRKNILYELQHRLKRFEIHCPALYVSYNNIDPPKDLQNKLIMIEYLLIDISLPSSNPMYGYRESYATQYFLVETKLMQTMPNIRYLHLIIQNHDIQRVCYFASSEMILFTFFKLQKIQIDVCGSTSENKESL